MSYKFTFTSSCEKLVEKACRKNPVLEKILDKKINQIILNPSHYKPLKNELAGIRRVQS